MSEGLGYNPKTAVAHLRKADPLLAEVIDRVGRFDLTIRPYASPFHALVRSIIFQQLHGKAATTIHGRVLRHFGEEAKLTPETLRDAPTADLRAAGLSANKLTALRDLAEKCLDGTVPDLATAKTLSDEALIERLTVVKGIGEWTVQMLLIFYLGRPDVLPTGDFAVRKAFKLLYRKRREPSPALMIRQTKHWQPYRSVGSWYLWRSLDTTT